MNIITKSCVIFFIAFASLLLFININKHPQTLYNWETYTLSRTYQVETYIHASQLSTYSQFTDGLMTDSAYSPFVGLPIRKLIHVFGLHLWSIRLFPVVIGILTAVVSFLFIRMIFSVPIAFLSTFFLVSSQAYLLYSRTATNVGISLFPFILTLTIIYKIWNNPLIYRYYLYLIGMLFINSYFYTPIRFLVPFSFFIIAIKSLTLIITFLKVPKNKKYHIKFGVIGAFFIVVASITTLFFTTSINNPSSLEKVITHYYNARGEHMLVKLQEEKNKPEPLKTNFVEYIKSNTITWIKLYANIETRPTITDYWNSHGQIIHMFLVPFFLLGLLSVLFHISQFKYFFVLSIFLLMSIPIIFTSNVHVGRLYFSLFPMYIIIVLGIDAFFNTINIVLKKLSRFYFPLKVKTAIIFLLALVILYQELTSFYFHYPIVDQANHVLCTNNTVIMVNGDETLPVDISTPLCQKNVEEYY
jgi:hypothetical protein